MATETVRLETRGAVALLTLNRPDEGNALNLQMAMDLLAAALACARDGALRAVVLTGAGRHFCFGGDLRAMHGRTTGADYIRELTTYLHGAIAHFMRMDAPVIAAANGTTAGAGIGLLAMADLAVCAADAKFNLAYTRAGLTPDAGTSFLLPRQIGARRTLELLLLNRTLGAEEALAWGLVNEVQPAAQLLARSLALAAQLARGARGAIGATKRLLADSLGALESQMIRESEAIAARAESEEGREGIRAFLEKRAAHFPGAPPAESEAPP
ncbi:MAG: enoyl-CoA hydratase/isomerase family protein [Gammaproteobacteria bacterium]|nr:enoyl-CoA hydratase/isomerase family protein [Gammaproteobacteria bacterium]MBV9620743.1 enoyl-CoA hydratase/isomerase family protein [Gammaproteobacteria bacterium]